MGRGYSHREGIQDFLCKCQCGTTGPRWPNGFTYRQLSRIFSSFPTWKIFAAGRRELSASGTPSERTLSGDVPKRKKRFKRNAPGREFGPARRVRSTIEEPRGVTSGLIGRL